MKISFHSHSILIKIVVTLVVGLMLSFSSSTPIRAQANQFVRSQGKDLYYGTQKVVLKGANFDNVSALGANIGSNDMTRIRIKEEDYKVLQQLGGNHARFGLSFSWYKTNKTQFFQILDQHIAWAKKYNLWLILNMFTTPGNCYEGYGTSCSLWTSDTEKQELENFWVDVATRYKNETAIVAFDLLNEPTPPWQTGGCSSHWFPLAQRIRNAISAVNQNHLVSIEACSDPRFDRVFKNQDGVTKATNVLYQVHDYDPMAFSHPGYNAQNYTKAYPGNAPVWNNVGQQETIYFDKTTFAGTRYSTYGTRQKLSLNWAEQQAVPIYIGEWGAQGWTPGYIQYIKDKAELYKEWDTNHAYLAWRHDVFTGWRWGVFPWDGPLQKADGSYDPTTTDVNRISVLQIAFSNAVNPTYTGTPASPVPTPIATPTPTPIPATPQPTPVPTAVGGISTFVRAQGKDLYYGSQKVVLKGANFDNITALGAGIGSNDMTALKFKEEDYKMMAQLGGNHARFGLSFSWYKANRTQFFQILDQHITWARQHNIWIMLNMFTTPGNCYEGYGNSCPFWDSTSEQQELQDFWVDVATRYKNEPVIVAYDLLNEPTPPWQTYSCNHWFSIAQRIRNAITAVDGNHLISVEACSDPSFSTLIKEANGTTKASNVLYQVHDYDPMAFSHPGWNATGYSKSYPGNASVWVNNGTQETLYFDKSTFAGTRYPQYGIQEKYSFNWATRNNVPIYVGEWGAQGWTPGYVQYTQDKADLYKLWETNHSYYTWRHDVFTGWRWGLFPRNGTLSKPDGSFDPTTTDVSRLPAIRTAFEGAVRPIFSTVTTTPTPQSTPVPTSPPGLEAECLRTDINEDGKTDLSDYGVFVQNFLKPSVLTQRADINRDGMVSLPDYVLFVRNFLQPCSAYTTPAPSSTPVVATPSPTIVATLMPTPTPVSETLRTFTTSNPNISVIETRAASGTTIFLKAQINSAVPQSIVAWYFGTTWKAQDSSAPFTFGTEAAGFTLPAATTTQSIRVVVFPDTTYNNFVEGTFTYTLQ